MATRSMLPAMLPFILPLILPIFFLIMLGSLCAESVRDVEKGAPLGTALKQEQSDVEKSYQHSSQQIFKQGSQQSYQQITEQNKHTYQQAAVTFQQSYQQAYMTRQDFISPLAGSWYESNPELLRAEIDAYLHKAEQEIAARVQGQDEFQGQAQPSAEDIRALLLPHAGLRWSGQTAAYGLAPLKGRKFKRIIVIGPSHRVGFSGASLPGAEASYTTVLGTSRLDTVLIDRLLANPFFHSLESANSQEHSVQVLLPMLQHLFGDFLFVPVVVGQLGQLGQPETATARAIGAALHAEISAHDTLIIASSDFTHYGPRFDYQPFGSAADSAPGNQSPQDITRQLRALDMGAFQFIADGDPAGFHDYVESSGATICGKAAITVLLNILNMMPGKTDVVLNHYTTSGAISGDSTNSVSYLSASFSGSPWEPAPPKHGLLGEIDREQLLLLARKSLVHYFRTGRKAKDPEELGVPVSAAMKQQMGAFVTLSEDGRLRGCIGEIVAFRPVFEAVMERAVDAAIHDSRFQPVVQDELDKLHIEISALTPLTRIDSPRRIVLGRDGIYLSRDGRSSVFLPQVAPEQGWNLVQTLSYLARKAGLPDEAWQSGCPGPDCRLETFQAEVFAEKEAL